MNRVRRAPIDINNLMPESCFMDLKQYNSKEVKEHIVDKEAHDKTVRAMIQEAIREHQKSRK
jgi:hypothetical protein